MFPDSLTLSQWGDVGEGLFRAVGMHRPPKAPLGMFGKISKMLPGKGMLALAAADVAISAGTAPKGHMISSTVSSLAGQTGGLLGAVIGQELIPIPVVGAIIGATVGGVLGDMALRSPTEHAVHAFTTLAKSVSHLEMGGDYEDTQLNLTMRQVAVKEMSRSVLNARAYLGKEAAFMHQ
jgi:hypothetical protein